MPPAPRRNITLSYADIALSSLMVGAGETYFAAFALAVGLSQVAAGLLGTIPLLAGGIVQLAAPLGPRLCGSYRRWVVGCVVLQGLSFVPLAVGCARGSMSLEWVYAVVSLYFIAGMAAGPAWSTWIDGIVPRRVFGGFLAQRARLTQLAAFTAFLGGGWLLHRLDQRGAALTAFLVLFLVAGAARVAAAWTLWKHDDLLWSARPAARFEIRPLVRTFFDPKRSRFLSFLLVNQVSVAIGGPYFASFFLGEAKYSYAAYTMILSANFLAKIVLYPYMGRWVRHLGPYRTLRIAGIFVAPLPLFWFLTPHVLPIVIVQVVAGIFWGSFELAQTMLVFDRIAPKERMTVLTAFGLLNAMAVVTGSLIGGGLLALAGASIGYPLIFTLSALARAGSLSVLSRKGDRQEPDRTESRSAYDAPLPARPTTDLRSA